MREPGLKAECLTLAAGSKELLRCASFRFTGGSLVVLTGPSGTGKTSLLRAVAGLSELRGLKVSGLLRVDGKTAYIPQEPWYTILAPYPVVEALAMGASLADFEVLAERLGVLEAAYKPAVSLSAGEAQRLAVALASLSGSNILLVDEVTAYLDERSKRESVKMLRELADTGNLVIVVDHDIESWAAAADYIAYMQGSKVTVYSDPREAPAYRAYLKALREAESFKPACSPGDPVAEAKDVSYTYPGGPQVLKGVSLTARRCEVIAVWGPSGSGKTTLLKLLAGALKPTEGLIAVRGPRLYIPENPLLFISAPTVGEELGYDKSYAELAGLSDAMDRPVGALSSGERRRLAIASAARRGANLIIVDEPGVGLDPWSALKVLKTLKLVAEKGAAVVVATHSKLVASAATKLLRLQD